MKVVADASPLIALGRIRRLDLLQSLFERILVPDAVWREVVESDPEKTGAADVAGAGWIQCGRVQDSAMVALLRHDLGAGEAEAIVLAREAKADFVLMDERLGRSAARSLGLNVVGLVGILIEGRERGLITDAPEIMTRLHREAGFWLSSELRKLVAG